MAKRRRQDSSRASWLAKKSEKSIGRIVVQMPPGERKSGMPHSVEIPAPEDETLVEESKKKTGRDQPMVELTYNWNTEDYGEARYFGHLAYEVDDIYATCEKLMKGGVTINRPPRDGNMAFVRSPDKHSI